LFAATGRDQAERSRDPGAALGKLFTNIPLGAIDFQSFFQIIE
jgi:hypothetical protein